MARASQDDKGTALTHPLRAPHTPLTRPLHTRCTPLTRPLHAPCTIFQPAVTTIHTSSVEHMHNLGQVANALNAALQEVPELNGSAGTPPLTASTHFHLKFVDGEAAELQQAQRRPLRPAVRAWHARSVAQRSGPKIKAWQKSPRCDRPI